MGDFNAAPDDPVINILTVDNSLVNYAKGTAEKGTGSYRYQGRWELIDQIFVSRSMTDPTSKIYTDPLSFRVFDAPFLLEDDPGYPGKKPFPTYSGYKWSGGYSDHLPVLITVTKKVIFFVVSPSSFPLLIMKSQAASRSLGIIPSRMASLIAALLLPLPVRGVCRKPR